MRIIHSECSSFVEHPSPGRVRAAVRAVEINEYGGPEVLKVVVTDAPDPGPGQITVDVAYAC